jgi:hypothetical protein
MRQAVALRSSVAISHAVQVFPPESGETITVLLRSLLNKLMNCGQQNSGLQMRVFVTQRESTEQLRRFREASQSRRLRYKSVYRRRD